MNVDAEKPMRKIDFARHCNVTPARVSQWISEGKISREALVGDGRAARISASVAITQLRDRLDASQSNGANTNLDFPPAAESPTMSPAASMASPDEIGAAIRREQLEGLQRRNRREQLEEAAASGRFVEVDAARAEMGRLARELVDGFEGALPQFAGVIATYFKIPRRDVLHVLRTTYRQVRGQQAEVARMEAEALPELVTVDLSKPSAPMATLEHSLGGDTC